MLLEGPGGQLQRMHLALAHLIAQQPVDETVSSWQSHPAEPVAGDLEPEVRLDSVARVCDPVVACVLVGVVEDLEMRKVREVGVDLAGDALGDRALDATVGWDAHTVHTANR